MSVHDEHDVGISLTGLPDHDYTADQYDCEGCHQRIHRAHDSDLDFYNQHNLLVTNQGDLPPDGTIPDGWLEWREPEPNDYYPRWLREYHSRYVCPRADEDLRWFTP